MKKLLLTILLLVTSALAQTPGVTVTGTLRDAQGNPEAGVVTFTLVNHGQGPATVSGSYTITNDVVTAQAAGDGTFSVSLFGNYQVDQKGTFYSLAFYHAGSKAPTSSAAYQFNVAGTFDISVLVPYVSTGSAVINLAGFSRVTVNGATLTGSGGAGGGGGTGTSFDPTANQNITGVWSFTHNVGVPNPVANTDAANKQWVNSVLPASPPANPVTHNSGSLISGNVVCGNGSGDAKTCTIVPLSEIDLGTGTVITEDPASPGTILVQDAGGNPMNIGDATNPVGSVTAQSLTVQNQIATGAVAAGTLQANNDPTTCPTGSYCYGGNSYTCPTAITGSPTGCILDYVAGVGQVYRPYWTNTGGGTPGLPSWWPTVPGTATVYGNLQNASGNPGTWTLCGANNSCSAGTANALGFAALTFGVASPSQSGAALQFSNTTAAGTVSTSGTSVTWVSGNKFQSAWGGTNNQPIKINGTTYTISGTAMTPGGCTTACTGMTLTSTAGTQSSVAYAATSGTDELAYRHLGSITAGNNTITNMTEDVWVYTNPGSGPGYEFDPDVGGNSGTYAYKASFACYSSSSGKWNVYDSLNHNWVATTYTCNWNTTGANAWHHIQLWVTYDQTNHQYTYKGLAVDGTDVWTPSSHAGLTATTYSACGPGCSGNTSIGSNVNIEMQIDNDSSGSTSIGYYDKYTLTVW